MRSAFRERRSWTLTAERDRPHAAGYIKKEPHGDLTTYYLRLTASPMFRLAFAVLSFAGVTQSVFAPQSLR